jgi:putative MATE family efflux protein
MKTENSLITEPIPKLLKIIALPAMIGFFFNTMYNVVDTWVAGQISDEALASLSLTFPVFFIIIAVSMGIGTGVTAIIANELGAKRLQTARHYTAQAILFGVIISLILTIIGYLASPSLFKLLGAEGTYLNTALLYMQTIFLGSIFFSMASILNGILNAVGDTKSYRNVLVVGFFINLILSPVLGLGWLGLPTLGVLGIAIATIISNLLGFIYLSYKVWQTHLVDTSNIFIPNKKSFADILVQGLPASFSMMTIALGAFIITYFVGQYGEDAIAGYGTALRIEQIALIPAIGINIAVLTLIGQNNGAKQFDRIKETIKYGLKYILFINTISALFIFFGAHYLLKIFTDAPNIIAFGTEYLTIAALISWAYGIIFITESVLRGLKRPIFPMIIGMFRQLILPIPIFYLVTFIFTLGIISLWWSIFAIVWLSAIISLLYTYLIIKRTDK